MHSDGDDQRVVAFIPITRGQDFVDSVDFFSMQFGKSRQPHHVCMDGIGSTRSLSMHIVREADQTKKGEKKWENTVRWQDEWVWFHVQRTEKSCGWLRE